MVEEGLETVEAGEDFLSALLLIPRSVSGDLALSSSHNSSTVLRTSPLLFLWSDPSFPVCLISLSMLVINYPALSWR